LADGGLLAACSTEAVRLDSSGNVVATYPSPGGTLFALAARPSDSSSYLADYAGTSSTVYQIDLATGSTIQSFTPSSENDIAGLSLVP
jgi:DNA-binding beta-propeller fold protein YncE